MLERRGWLSLILGILTTIFGLIPLLHTIKVIKFDLPFSIAGLVLEIILVLGGIFLLIDCIHEDGFGQIVTIIIGLLIVILGGIPILFRIGVVGFDISSFLALEIVKNIILIAAGIALIAGSGD